MNRREFLNFLGKGALITSFSPMILRGVSNIKDKPILNSNIFPSKLDDVVLATDLQYEILISWGEKISSKDRFGFNNDYIGFIKGKNKSEGFLWVNHEYVHPLFFSSKPADQKTLSDIKKEMYNVGGSFFKIKRKRGKWNIDLSANDNQRVSALDKIDFDNDTTIEGSKKGVGTLANCSGHITPWNTVLTCEENYDMFYGERNRKDGKIIYPSYTLGWEKYFAFPPEHYGWVVEIDPFANKKRKLISLGRCAHECAHLKELEDGRLVVYTGDDIDNGCIYKFVSKSPKDLTNGVLYVASLEQKKWIPVQYDKHAILQEKFNSQLEVLTYLREASRLIGGSQLDRPEDIDIDPLEQGVFIALTNNFAKNNFHGSILKITEKDNKHDSEEFDFEHLVSGGEETGFSCPDNLIFDKVGNLWFTSDITGSRLNKSPYEKFGNNGLFVLIRNGDQAGKIIQIASAPVEAEFTGPCFSPDWKTLFLSVQHPGERSVSLRNVSSKWPKEKGGPKPAVISISGKFLKDIMT